jgi:hypothetical protein
MAKRVQSKSTRAQRVFRATKMALWEFSATIAVCGAVVGVMLVALRVV